MKIKNTFLFALCFSIFNMHLSLADVRVSNGEYIVDNGKFKAIMSTRIVSGDKFDISLLDKAISEFDNKTIVKNGKTSRAFIEELIKSKAKDNQVFHFIMRPVENHGDYSVDCGFSKKDNSSSKAFFDDPKAEVGMVEVARGTYKSDFISDIPENAKARLIAKCLNRVTNDSLRLYDAQNVYKEIDTQTEAVNAFSNFLDARDSIYKFVSDRDKKKFLSCLVEEKVNSFRGNIYADNINVKIPSNSKKNAAIQLEYVRKSSTIKITEFENFSDLLVDGSFDKCKNKVVTFPKHEFTVQKINNECFKVESLKAKAVLNDVDMEGVSTFSDTIDKNNDFILISGVDSSAEVYKISTNDRFSIKFNNKVSNAIMSGNNALYIDDKNNLVFQEIKKATDDKKDSPKKFKTGCKTTPSKIEKTPDGKVFYYCSSDNSFKFMNSFGSVNSVKVNAEMRKEFFSKAISYTLGNNEMLVPVKKDDQEQLLIKNLSDDKNSKFCPIESGYSIVGNPFDYSENSVAVLTQGAGGIGNLTATFLNKKTCAVETQIPMETKFADSQNNIVKGKNGNFAVNTGNDVVVFGNNFKEIKRIPKRTSGFQEIDTFDNGEELLVKEGNNIRLFNFADGKTMNSANLEESSRRIKDLGDGKFAYLYKACLSCPPSFRIEKVVNDRIVISKERESCPSVTGAPSLPNKKSVENVGASSAK